MKRPEIKGTEKYVTNFDYDLAGQTFALAMDNGYEYAASFLSGEILMWAERGEPLRWDTYRCLKSDDTTYFVVIEPFGQPLRTCLTLILDLENSLVTMHKARQGGVPNRPRMAEVDIVFGAIRRPGQPLPVKRHSYTADLVGKKINWTYSSGFVNTHIYMSENYCRARAITRPIPPDAKPEDIAQMRANEEREKVWIYEEPIRCVKIKDNCYLCSFIEENMNKMDSRQSGNNLMILSNMKDGFDVGRTFRMENDQRPDCGLFVAHGEFTDEDIELEHRPSPYRV